LEAQRNREVVSVDFVVVPDIRPNVYDVRTLCGVCRLDGCIQLVGAQQSVHVHQSALLVHRGHDATHLHRAGHHDVHNRAPGHRQVGKHSNIHSAPGWRQR